MKKMSNSGGFRQSLWKFICVMKITILLITFSSMLGWGMNSYSQNKHFTFDFKTATVKQVFDAIEHNSEFIIFYQDQNIDLNRKVTIRGRSLSVSEVLDKIFEGSDNVYRINNRQIIIGKKAYRRPEVIISHPKTLTITKINVQEPPKEQGRKIIGHVVGVKDGQPLAGVAILVKGTNVGTTTDIDGNYTLANVPADATLVFSLVGMKKQEVKVKGRTSFNVTLEEENASLDQVVVIAYGTQKKVAVTGAVSAVGSKELMQSSSASLANALAGRISGLTSLQNSGAQPGVDDATMYLRGVATTNGSSPLVLIDGVPRDNIRTLDANEVESVSVLKDASATAVFGVRGANGVILITTKRGQLGKPQLNLNVEQSFTSFTREPSRLHSWDYCEMRNQALESDGEPDQYSADVIAKYKNPLLGLDPTDANYAADSKLRRYIYCDNDYYRMFIRRYTPQTRINMNVSGGTQKVKYFVNAGYLHEGGNLNTESKSSLGYDPAAKMDRFSFRSNLDYNISKSLSAFLNLGSYIEQVNMPNSDLYPGGEGQMMTDLFYEASSILPITPGPTVLEGYGIAAGSQVDPTYLDRSAFEVMNRRGYDQQVRSNLNSSLGINWDLSHIVTRGLSLKGMISYDSYAYTQTDANKYERLYEANVDYDTNTLSYTTTRAGEQALSISKFAQSKYTINLQGSINYSRKFGKHEVGGLVLAQRDYWEVTDGNSSVLLLPYNVIGLVGRATYNYDNKYFAEYDMGYNGSEQFAPSRRFGYFPAVSGGWVISNEDFLKDNRTLTNLKLRASVGKVGNDQQGSSRFIYLDNMTIGTGGYSSSLASGKYVSEGLMGNSQLTWESALKKNVGVDFQLFKELSGSFDYFREHRTGILINRHTVPTFQGVYLSYVPMMNIGVVDNHGYELELTYNKSLTRDLSFMIKGNYSYNHNTVVNYDEVKKGSEYHYQTTTEGFSLGQCWGYQIDWKDHGGYWVSKDEINSSGLSYSGTAPRVGDFKYVDQNKDGVIDDKDLVPIGYSSLVPRINYGINLSVNYKAFDFSIFFQGVGKYSMYYSGKYVFENIKNGTYYSYMKDAWTLDRYLKGENISYPALSTGTSSSQCANDFFIMNRAFTRLKNIELGYTLPKSALKALGISRLRLSVGGQNLFTWDHLRMNHLDPEQNNPSGYPETKMMNIGLNVTF